MLIFPGATCAHLKFVMGTSHSPLCTLLTQCSSLNASKLVSLAGLTWLPIEEAVQ